MEQLKELLLEELQDIYHAEGQLLKALPKIAKAAKAPELREAFETHLEETKEQIQRLETVFETLGASAEGKPCKGMQGLIAEGQEVIGEGKDKDDVIADLALIAAAQKVEHYEISAYGTARTMAEHLGEDEVVDLLNQTLEEEEKTDELLTSVAESLYGEVEEEAEDGAEGDEEDEDEDMDLEDEELDEEADEEDAPAKPSKK